MGDFKLKGPEPNLKTIKYGFDDSSKLQLKFYSNSPFCYTSILSRGCNHKNNTGPYFIVKLADGIIEYKCHHATCRDAMKEKFGSSKHVDYVIPDKSKSKEIMKKIYEEIKSIMATNLL